MGNVFISDTLLAAAAAATVGMYVSVSLPPFGLQTAQPGAGDHSWKGGFKGRSAHR